MRALSIMFVALAAAPALAAAQATPAPSEARIAFEQAVAAYEEGRFAEAAAQFDRCHELTQDAEVLFNAANAYDRLRQDAEALDRYRRYLALRPDTADRAQVEARVAILEQALAAPAEPGPAHAPAIEVSEPMPSSPVPTVIDDGAVAGGWTLIGTGAASLIAGIVLLVLAQTDLDAVAGATRWQDVEDRYHRAPIASGLGVGGLGLGVALAAGGAIWLAIGGAL